jgi:hypothetical protein
MPMASLSVCRTVTVDCNDQLNIVTKLTDPVSIAGVTAVPAQLLR